jgi:hypothetical protein
MTRGNLFEKWFYEICCDPADPLSNTLKGGYITLMVAII